MDLDTLTPTKLEALTGTFAGPDTRRITDYLSGYQLGPRHPVTITLAGGKTEQPSSDEQITYWAGDLLPSSDGRYKLQVDALRRSFVFRNVLLEGVEMLADGVGADEPDWSFTVSRPLADGEEPTQDEQALSAELEGLLTAWWDRRDLPSLIQQAVVSGIAHGRQPLRPRIPERFRTATGELEQRDAAQSLDSLWLTLPEVADSGIYTDPDTMQPYGLSRVLYAQENGAYRTGWEVTWLDDDGRTIVRAVRPDGQAADTDPIPLGGQLWLLELKFARGAVTRDALANQDALNVALTSLSRNTRWAAFEKTIMLGIDPPVDDEGRIQKLSGPGAESYLQPSVQREVEQTGQLGADGRPATVTRERMYPGASVTKLDPAEPKAIQASIEQAEANIYSILRQRFMLMATANDPSGRSREVTAGPYLRAVARYSTAVEAFIRDILLLAARVSAIVQGQPGKYDGLRPVVSCRQKVFEPSADTINTYLSLHKDGVISLQTLRTTVGVADPDAEQRQLDKERAAAPAPEPDPAP